MSHLLLGQERGVYVTEDHRPVITVGEVDPVEGHQALARPIKWGTLLGFPWCFALQLCVLYHTLH